MATVVPEITDDAYRSSGGVDAAGMGDSRGTDARGTDLHVSRMSFIKCCSQACPSLLDRTADCWHTVVSQKLDTALVVQGEDRLVVQSHRVASKVFGVAAWVALSLWLLTVLYGAAAYSLGQEMRWSPRYMEQKQWEALMAIDQLLQAEAEMHLMMNHTRAIPAPVYGIGNSWWPFVVLAGICVCCISCCVPPERMVTFDRGQDKWWVEEIKYSFTDFCLRCDCWNFGKPFVIAASQLSSTYVDLSLEDRTQGVGGCGPTRWRTDPATPSIKLRGLSNGTVHHIIDADTIMCCYDSRCCLDEGTIAMQGLTDRIRGFMDQIHTHLKAAVPLDTAGGDIQTADEILDARLHFSKLHKLDAMAQKQHYRTDLGIWDVEGVLEDTRIAGAKTILEGRAVGDASEDGFEAVLEGTNGEHLFAWLQKYDLEACKEDYFHSEGGWDVEGVRSDLKHARLLSESRRFAMTGAAAAAPTAKKRR